MLRAAAIAAGSSLAAPFAVGGPVSAYGQPVPVLDTPESVTVFFEGPAGSPLSDPLSRQPGGRWESRQCSFSFERAPNGVHLTLEAPKSAVERVRLRWNAAQPVAQMRVLGDAWERSYGDLGWREIVPERALPWYFLTHDGHRAHGYGVMTGASAFAFWQCDAEGVTLWLDVRNGGSGVLLGGRRLAVATIVARDGLPGESSFAAARALCRQMCLRPRLPSTPIYGSNDWYYAYGKSSANDILRDADLMAELAPVGGARPFTVIDDGWRDAKRFPDMAALASGIVSRGVQPGVWIRPLEAKQAPTGWLMPGTRCARPEDREQNASYDPTVPEALDRALAKVREVKAWGFRLIKHDFSTYDLLGQWGNAMDASPALSGWSFHDRTRTSAEIIRGFYESLREAAGEVMLIGCNTVGHLAAGIFEAQRIGDDVSGKVWERTRRMGVNSLAFRLPQHGTFFAADADCVPLTAKIPWNLSRQWMDVVAWSGTALVISAEPNALDRGQKAAVRAAFAIAAAGSTGDRPLDWTETHTPNQWQAVGGKDSPRRYHWLEDEGASPFDV